MYWVEVITGAVGVTSVIFCVVPMFIDLTQRRIYYIIIASILCLCAVQIVVLQQFYFVSSGALDIVMWLLFCLCYGVIGMTKEVAFAQTLGLMVTSHVQNLSEGVRYAVLRLGSSLALIGAAFVFPYMGVAGCVYLVVLLVMLLMVCVGRGTLIEPQVVLH